MLVPLLYDLLLAVTCLAAWLRGEGAEKAAASVMLLGTVLTFAMADKVDLLFASVGLQLVLVDAAALAAFVLISLRSRKFWPLWASALQLLTVFASFAPLFHARMRGLAYALNEQIWAWPILVVIFAASLLVKRKPKLNIAS
jgi:uncharacterized membrane protein (UPF0136 family)